MDTRALQLLMDINTMQNFGAVNSFSSNSQSAPSVFNMMLEDMMGSEPQNDSLLGSLTNPENLSYSGQNDVFQPSSLAQLLSAQDSLPIQASTQASTTKNSTAYSGQYEDIIKEAAQKHNVPERLISSVIKHESSFNTNSVSHAGASGLMQLMPGTAKFLGVKDSFDPVQNINGGAKYLRQMLNQFNDNMELAVAAYNAGPGNVKKYGGIPPFNETQNYVKKVLNTFNA